MPATHPPKQFQNCFLNTNAIAITTALFGLLSPLSAADTKIYDEVNGTIIMEMENTPSPLGQWVKRTKLKPFTGECYLEFMGNNEAFGPPNSPLEYRFRINSPGTYSISIRSHKRLTSDEGVAAREDMCNDAYARVEGDFASGNPEVPTAWLKRDTKFWGKSLELDWTNWANRIVENHAIKDALYDFKAGEVYTLFISGRAQRFSLDRIVVSRVADQRQNDTAGESPLVGTSKITPKRGDPGDGSAALSGELKQWHAVTLDLAGPWATEIDTTPNPFTDLAFEVTFTHSSGNPSYRVPGYFAADGQAGSTSATQGHVWRAHLSPDKTGVWSYRIHFSQGHHVAMNGGGTALAPFDGQTGEFTIANTDKTGRDFRGKGRLIYDGSRYLKHAGTGQVFIKAGPDSPETLLAYVDIDGTFPHNPKIPLKTWEPHLNDWQEGDPTWQDGKGKGLIGALNYLDKKGLNNVSFLTYNAGGDGDDVWPFISRDDKFHYDCSKLDQWGIVFDHATAIGLHLHFKLQETEMDDNRAGPKRVEALIPEALDGGKTGPERKLYFREMIARYAHHLALNWNFGEENTQSAEEQRAMAKYVAETDPYQHNRVIHTYPFDQDSTYTALLGDQSLMTGASLQNMWDIAHERTHYWVTASERSGRPWIVANDEQGPAQVGVPPDLGYRGYNSIRSNGDKVPFDQHDIRKATLWGTLMAGGAGVEYLFGYQVAENDLNLEDFRSRDQTWDYCRIAIDFFSQPSIPVGQMVNADELVGNPDRDNSRYCFAQHGKLYLVYLPNGGSAELDLAKVPGNFSLEWFNPRTGGPIQKDTAVKGMKTVTLAAPSTEDWLAIVRRE